MNGLKKYVDRYPVNLNIYDMIKFNRYLEKIGLGVYHSGIEVFGAEFSFGGHPCNSSGVFRIEPKSAEKFQKTFKFKETVFIGYTDSNENDFIRILNSLGNSRFKGNKYHLFFNNCNHFTTQLAVKLCGKTIPGRVNRVARISSNIPLLEAILPRQILTPTITMVPNEIYDNTNDNKKNYIV